MRLLLLSNSMLLLPFYFILLLSLESVNSITSSSFPKASKSPNVKNAEKNQNNKRQEKEQLFEAYNLLHSLAQDFHKPFDSPAVIVVGHQTSGKSALIEALMGFQFNQVGGGTKTRRPVALRMQYNPLCTSPLCFLTLENGKEEKRSLADIQAYIESENKRLERDPSRSFDSREINIRMEYKYCPNMIVIDTPGMLHPPKGKHLTPQQRALAQASREAESLVLSKIKCEDYIILCVEDTTDWKHATTRNIVMQADPELSRTVLVTTKLDTKLPQFSEPEDLEDFIKAPLVSKLFPRMLGGPFFTSVPAGRVGVSKDFLSNEMFVSALKGAERKDKDDITTQIGVTNANNLLKHVGVTQLRTFLESRVEECYRRNVAKIVPLLQNELRVSEVKLTATEEELNSLSIERLRKGANVYREKFAKELAEAIHGTVKAKPEEWGETLENEQLRGGSFMSQDQVRSVTWQNVLEAEVGHNKQKLFGGAQYHRALREFTVAVRHMKTPSVTEDEIANAAGMGEVHDGVNFMRAACVIAIEKAQQCFEPMLEALRRRSVHIMRRLFPIVEHMSNRQVLTGSTSSFSSSHSSSHSSHSHLSGGSGSSGAFPLSPSDPYNRPLQEMIRKIFDKFVEKQMDICLDKCRDDLRGMTRFVTWDADGRGGSSTLYKGLPTPKKMAEIYTVAVDSNSISGINGNAMGNMGSRATQVKVKPIAAVPTIKAKSQQKSSSNSKGGRGLFGGNNNKNNDKNNNKNDKNKNKNKNNKNGNNNGGDNVADQIMNEWSAANGSNSQTDEEEVEEEDDDFESLIATTGSTDTTASATALITPSKQSGVGLWEQDAEVSDYYNLLQLMEEMLAGRNANRTTSVVTAIVQFIIKSWTDHFARTVSMKFNCFFLMPFLDDFPGYLRNELDRLYDSDVDEMFDIAEARAALQIQRRDLQAECEANSKLQRRFDSISLQLRSAASTGGVGVSGSGMGDMSGSSASDYSTDDDEDDDASTSGGGGSMSSSGSSSYSEYPANTISGGYSGSSTSGSGVQFDTDTDWKVSSNTNSGSSASTTVNSNNGNYNTGYSNMNNARRNNNPNNNNSNNNNNNYNTNNKQTPPSPSPSSFELSPETIEGLQRMNSDIGYVQTASDNEYSYQQGVNSASANNNYSYRRDSNSSNNNGSDEYYDDDRSSNNNNNNNNR